MSSDDINLFIAIQPCLVTLILCGAAVNGFFMAIDFVLSALCPKWWHSPCGFHVIGEKLKNSKNDNSNIDNSNF